MVAKLQPQRPLLPPHRGGTGIVGGVAHNGQVSTPSERVVIADYPGCPVTVQEALDRGEVLRAPRWGIGSALIAIFGAGTVAVLVVNAAVVIGAPLFVLVIAGTLVPWVVLAGWPMFATWWKGNGPRIDLGLRLTWSDVGWGVLAGFIGLILAATIALITQAIVGDFSSSAGDVAVRLRDEGPPWTLVAFALLVMVGAPIAEEIAFRGQLFNALRKKGVSTWLTIVITAVAFSAFHLEPVRFFLLLPIGLVYGWVRWKTGSLGAAMVAHGVHNAPAALVLLLGFPEVTP